MNPIQTQSFGYLLPQLSFQPVRPGLRQHRAVLAQGIHCALETEPFQFRLVNLGCLGHQATDEVVCDQSRQEFLADHRG
jgi:hypothetical protein